MLRVGVELTMAGVACCRRFPRVFRNKRVHRGIYLSLEQGERRLWEEHLPGLMAPFLRKRFSEAGVYTLTVDLDPLDSAIGLPYELRVRTVVGGGSRSVAPLLTIVAAKNARIQVGPRSAERTPETSWRDTVRPGTYRVYASGLDSLAVCRVPCRKPVFVRLAGASTLTIRP